MKNSFELKFVCKLFLQEHNMKLALFSAVLLCFGLTSGSGNQKKHLKEESKINNIIQCNLNSLKKNNKKAAFFLRVLLRKSFKKQTINQNKQKLFLTF